MTHSRFSQPLTQVLALAKADQWQAIQLTDDELINEAVKFKSLPLLDSIIQKEFDVALRRAIVSNAPYALITLLIPLRKNINSGSSKQHNRTSLHFAAQSGRVDIIPELIQAGAYVNMLDGMCYTPAHLACQSGHANAALVLAQAGAYTAGNITPDSLIPSNKKLEFLTYIMVAQQQVLRKMQLPSGRDTKFKTLIEPNNALLALSTLLPREDQSNNITLEGMIGEGRMEAYNKMLDICALRGVLTITAKDYIALDKTYSDVLPMHLTQMLLGYGNANNDNVLISASQHQVTKITNLAIQWAEVEGLSQYKFSLTFRDRGMDSFFLLSDDADLKCDSKFIRKARDGKLIIDDKHVSSIIKDLIQHPITKDAIIQSVSTPKARAG